MSIKYSVSKVLTNSVSVIYEGEAATPEAALAAVATLSNGLEDDSHVPEAGDTVIPIPASAFLPVGSKVVATENATDVPEGTKGTVEEVDYEDTDIPYRVYFDGYGMYWVYACEIAPDAISEAEERKPRVGATIRIVDPVIPIRYVKGDEGEITDFYPGGSYKVKFPQNPEPVCVFPHEAEVIA